jgi:hypothetical protein
MFPIISICPTEKRKGVKRGAGFHRGHCAEGRPDGLYTITAHFVSATWASSLVRPAGVWTFIAAAMLFP